MIVRSAIQNIAWLHSCSRPLIGQGARDEWIAAFIKVATQYLYFQSDKYIRFLKIVVFLVVEPLGSGYLPHPPALDISSSYCFCFFFISSYEKKILVGV